jgi:DtxR family Mn-dependent transcriptional regulator
MIKSGIFILNDLDQAKRFFWYFKMQSQTVEDYLKAIYEIQQVHSKVATSMLADRLGVSPASVTSMLKKLADLRLVVYEPYQGVVLTEAGQKIALEVIRHHRLIELFLAEALGVPWDQVHAEAHKIEHVLSEDLEDRIDAILGFPTIDPHGAPIPARDGSLDHSEHIQLSDLRAGQSAVVAEVSDRDAAMLRYLGELGLYPQVHVSVIAVAPFDGPLTLRVGDAEHIVGRAVADRISVTAING